MSKKEILDRIEILLSPKKITLYKEKYSDAWLDAYKLELEQAKEVFIYLHFLEVFLRNKIATELSKDFGDWLFDPRCHLKLNFREQEKVGKVLVELNKTSKELNSDNVVSSLNFGFWTNLFHKSYNYSIWQQNKMIERVFPYLKDYERNLSQIQKEMEAIRKFRNRIFHFESMQSWNFAEMKKLINKFIYGIGGVMVDEILGTF
jgi:hypothetical protein